MKFILVTVILILTAVSAFAQADSGKTVAVEELYLAKDDGNGKAGEQVSEFSTADVPIYCVVLLDDAQKVTVKMNFVAVGVPGIKADTKVVSASYTTKEGQNRVNFSGRPEGKWPPGKYRVDIFLDGKAAKALEFDIKAVGTNTGGNNTAKKLLVAEEPKVRPTRKTPRP
jgi:hypothetical protein